VEFRDEFERSKAINLELRSRLVLAAGEVLPMSIFDGPIEGFGADISKLHKRIMEELDEFRSRDLSQRAASVPITDHRRMAFFANSKDLFSKSLFNGLPVLIVFKSIFASKRSTTFSRRFVKVRWAQREQAPMPQMSEPNSQEKRIIEIFKEEGRTVSTQETAARKE
jgi:hypothetical protein